mgnify:CR=1 FL=1
MPEAELSLPTDGGQIDLRALNSAGYITVRFRPTPGAVLDLDTVLDVEQEIMLSGLGLGSVMLNGVPTQIDDSPFFKYGFTGAFGTGPVQVTYLRGSFEETDGVDGTVNANVEAVESFLVVGPTARLLDRGVDVVLLNERGYLDVQFDASFGASLVESSLTDSEAEFTLSGSAAGGVTVAGVPTNPSGDGVTWRYTFDGQFQPGDVSLNFAAGTWSDTLNAVVVANLGESETLTVLGPTIELIWPQAGIAGLGLLNQNHYIDVKFRPTWGNSLDESTVLDGLPELSLSGSAVSGAVTVEDTPEPLGDGVYRYDFTGDLQPDRLQIVFAAGAVEDQAGYASLAQTQIVTVVELTAGLAYPVAGSRVSAEEINDVSYRYLEVTFADPLGVGLDKGSITDTDTEIEVWAKGENGDDIQISVGAVSEGDGYYRYALEGDLPIGPVTVKYLAGSWADKAGNLGSTGQQSFLVTPTAANLSIYVGGSVELFAGMEDVRLLHLGGEVFLQAESEGPGSRVQVDMNGQIDLLYLGTVGAAAGRFVLDIPTEGDAGMWGVLRIDSNFQKLKDLGIVLDAYCLLEVNTTDEAKSEELTLAGQAEGGSDLTRTFDFGPEMFRIEAAGVLTIADAFELDGDFWVEVCAERFLLDAEANLLLGRVGALSAASDLIVDSSGVRACVAVDGQLGSEDIGLTLAEADGLFEVNTTDQPWDHDKRPATLDIPAGSLRVAVDADFNFVGFAEGSGEASVTFENHDFQLVIDGELDLGGVLDVDVHAYVGILDDDPATGGVDEAGVIIDAAVDLDVELWGIVDMDVGGRFRVNTTGVTMSGYRGATIEPDGGLAFGAIKFVDAYGVSKALNANSFSLDLKGKLELLSVLTFSGRSSIDMAGGTFRMDVAMGVNFFGIGWLDAEGGFNSEGEYSIDIDGGVGLGVAGCGLFGTGWLNLSYMDNNGIALGGNGLSDHDNYMLDVDAGFNVRAELFHVSLASAGVAFTYDQDTGRMNARSTVKFLWWSKSYTFYIGCLQTPPPANLAGNLNGNSGTAFSGGELYLNMGDRAAYRDPEATNETGGFEVDESFIVEYRGWSEENGHTVRVRAFGTWEDYRGVTKIIADGGSGIDTIRIMSDDPMPVPVVIRGGDDDDYLEVSTLVSVAEVDGGPGMDRVTVVGDDLSQTLRVFMDAENVVRVESDSKPFAKLAGVETIGLSGGEGADSFEVSGELDLAGVKGVVVDLGSADGDLDEVQLTLSDDTDEFEFAPFDVGLQGVWKNHFTFDVVGGWAPDGDKMDVYAQAGADQVKVYRDPANRFEGAPFYLTTGGSQVGLAYTLDGIGDLTEIDALVVDTAEDENDGNFVPGDLSLREAIARTNTGGENSDVDMIFFAPRLGGSTITLASALGQLSINDNLTITGPNVSRLTINGNKASRIFLVDNGNALTTIEVGIGTLSLVDGKGPSSSHGGGIYNRENLSVQDCVLMGHRSYRDGGAVYSERDLTVVDSRIATCKADYDDNNTGSGGAICGAGRLTVVGSTIEDSWSGVDGGGVALGPGSVGSVVKSTISANSADGHGGGIYSLGTLSVVDSTIADNKADVNNTDTDHGGGIYTSGTLTVVGSTISDNGSYGDAGGIFAASDSTVTVRRSTISGNKAKGHGGGIYSKGTLTPSTREALCC